MSFIVTSGIKLFVKWFKNYHSSNMNKMNYKRNQKAKTELDTKLLNQEVDHKNEVFHKRHRLLRNKLSNANVVTPIIVSL